MQDDPTKIQIKCPICKKEKKVNLPQFLFENKSTPVKKIQVDAGIVCDHPFIIFVNDQGNVIGYERSDATLDFTRMSQRQKLKVSLQDLMDNFGEINVILMLHAVIIDCPVIFVSSKTDIQFIVGINHLFNSLLPKEVKSPFLFSSLEKKYISNAPVDSALVFSETNQVQNISWDKVAFSLESDLIKKTQEFLDPQIQIDFIREQLEPLFEKCKFLRSKFKEWERADKRYYRKIGKLHEFKKRTIYEDDARNLLREEYLNISQDQIDLIIQIMRNRFKENIYKVESVSTESVEKKMPKKRKRRFFSRN